MINSQTGHTTLRESFRKVVYFLSQKTTQEKKGSKLQIPAQQNTSKKASPAADDFPDLDTMNVSSATELTGMMYHPPASEAELESYHDLYDMEYDFASNSTGRGSKKK